VTRETATDAVPSPSELAGLWRERAALLRRHGAEASAMTLEATAGELEAALRAESDTLLTLHDAAQESGLSADRLRHLVAAGTIPNAGRRGAPRVRRQDLPVKSGTRRGTYDPYADATNVRVHGQEPQSSVALHEPDTSRACVSSIRKLASVANK
jgi:hypothetical protein